MEQLETSERRPGLGFYVLSALPAQILGVLLACWGSGLAFDQPLLRLLCVPAPLVILPLFSRTRIGQFANRPRRNAVLAGIAAAALLLAIPILLAVDYGEVSVGFWDVRPYFLPVPSAFAALSVLEKAPISMVRTSTRYALTFVSALLFQFAVANQVHLSHFLN